MSKDPSASIKRQPQLMRYVALLRGINVGGNAVVSMKDLKSCFERLGLRDVTTYINSGNILFSDSRTSVSALAEHIETGIKKYCRMDIRVVVKSKDDIARICEALPEDWVTDKTMRTDVMFLWDDVDSPEVIAQIAINPQEIVSSTSKAPSFGMSIERTTARASCRKSSGLAFTRT